MIPIIICKFSSFDLDAAVQQGLISCYFKAYAVAQECM